MISPDIITMPAASQDFYGKTAGEMVTDAWVGQNGTVTGTFHYMSGYTGFNDALPEEQEGYYFPFTLAKSGTTMTFKKNGEISKDSIPWEANNVFRVTPGDLFEVLVDGAHVVTFNFAEAEFEPKTVLKSSAKQRAKSKTAS